MPWAGVDPIVIGSQIVMSLQTIVSRSVNITEAPAVVTIGRFNGGNRFNMSRDRRAGRHGPRLQRRRPQGHSRRIREIATKIAEYGQQRCKSAMASAIRSPSTIPIRRRGWRPPYATAGADNVRVGPLTGIAEDFSFYRRKCRGCSSSGRNPARSGHYSQARQSFAAVFRRRIRVAGRRRVMANPALDFLPGSKPTELCVAHATGGEIDLGLTRSFAPESRFKHVYF